MAAKKGNNYSALRKKNPTYTDQQIQDIIDHLLEWAHNGKGIYLASYIYENYKKSENWLLNLADHHPEMKPAIDQAKELIGGKVANHCFEGDKNSAFGEKILPIYSKLYRAETERKASLAKPTNDSQSFTFEELKNAIRSGSLLDLLKQEEEAKK